LTAVGRGAALAARRGRSRMRGWEATPGWLGPQPPTTRLADTDLASSIIPDLLAEVVALVPEAWLASDGGEVPVA